MYVNQYKFNSSTENRYSVESWNNRQLPHPPAHQPGPTPAPASKDAPLAIRVPTLTPTNPPNWQACSTQRPLLYDTTFSSSGERFHLIHRSKHRKSNKMGRQATMPQMKENNSDEMNIK